jgi:hypothetical protein
VNIAVNEVRREKHLKNIFELHFRFNLFALRIISVLHKESYPCPFTTKAICVHRVFSYEFVFSVKAQIGSYDVQVSDIKLLYVIYS